MIEYEQFLDRKYWDSHFYLMYFIDSLADMLIKADELRLSEVKIESSAETDGYEMDDLFEWMDSHGHHDKSIELFRNHMFYSLLKDFRYYMFESLSCAARGKITVAYSLLRKPLKETFVYIEWLLADAEDVYDSILNKEPSEYDVTNSRIFTDEKLREIMELASKKTYMGGGLNTKDLVYNLRFNHEEEISLERIWNKTMHVVTNRKTYKTDKGNLNFIFTDNEEWVKFIDYYYTVMPQVCAYIYEVCEGLFLMSTDVDKYSVMFNRALRLAKYAQFIPLKGLRKQLTFALSKLIDIGSTSNIFFYIPCEACNGGHLIKKKDCKVLEREWSIMCDDCGTEIDLCKYNINLDIQQNGASVKNFL